MYARVIKVVPLSKNGGKHGGVPIHLKEAEMNCVGSLSFHPLLFLQTCFPLSPI